MKHIFQFIGRIGVLVGLVGFLLPSQVKAISCGLSDNATNTLNTACVIDGPPFTEGGTSYYSGIANGDMVVSGADVTVSPGVTMTWSPGKAIMIQNGGRIIRGANAVLKQVDPMAWFRQQLGFDTYAAGVPVKILGQNLHVCTADPCTVTGPSGGGSLVVENSIKFADGTTQTTAASGGVPATGVMFFNAASCPTGWTELTAARGMTMVGLPAAGTLAGTVGTGLTNLATRTITTVPAHTHAVDPPATTSTSTSIAHTHSIDPPNTGVSISDPGHSHSVTALSTGCGNCSWRFAGATTNDGGGVGGGTSSNTTGISASVDIAAFTSGSGDASHTHSTDVASFTSGSTGTASVDVTMPYIQLLACQKS